MTEPEDKFTTPWHGAIPLAAGAFFAVHGAMGLRNGTIGIATRFGSEFSLTGADARKASWILIGCAALLLAAGLGVIVRERRRRTSA